MVLSHRAKFQLIINFFRVCMYFVVFLPDYKFIFTDKGKSGTRLGAPQNYLTVWFSFLHKTDLEQYFLESSKSWILLFSAATRTLF